ncbi:hypothetical protein E2C01_077902 [Portunus trituberculatus]|uniref:Uncharacterized protein n=1 Tax=Portunus trituberculatus TaxID=210409 RepID=A0A5B7IFM2_PORTR|nr:hypothetical protein [Portunus trituberculatus]
MEVCYYSGVTFEAGSFGGDLEFNCYQFACGWSEKPRRDNIIREGQLPDAEKLACGRSLAAFMEFPMQLPGDEGSKGRTNTPWNHHTKGSD